MTEKRIISLSPAITEIICALGFEKQLVGVSIECANIDAVQGLPICVIPEIDKDLFSKLKPDFVFGERSQLSALKTENSHLVDFDFANLDDVFKNISLIGEVLNVNESSQELNENLREGLDIIIHKLKFSEIKPKTACITQLSPLLIGENFLPKLIEIARGSTLSLTNISASMGLDWEAFKLEDPQIIIVMPEKYPIQRTLQEINLLLNLPGWSDLSAVKNNRFYIADGSKYGDTIGIQSFDVIEILAEIIHPKQFVFGNEGKGWIKFNS